MNLMLRIVCAIAAALLFSQLATAQITLDAKSHPRNVPTGSSTFPCYARVVNKPKTFSGFWSPRPANGQNEQVTITIGFDKPDPRYPFDCVGEPLEITVPNNQIVNLVPSNWPTAPGACTSTLTVTPAATDSPIPDLLALAAKLGVVGLDTQSIFYALPQLKNKTLTVNVVCSVNIDADGKVKRKLTQSVKITYQNPPRIVVSGGLLVGAPSVKSYSINTVETGVGSNGVVTTQSSIAVSGPPAAQVIPFGFVNLYLAGSRKLNVATQFGVGVNPNLSTARVEFFAAPIAVAWHDFYFSPGFHFGQHQVLKGGFSVGDITSGLSQPPTAWKYYTGFGFSFSYNLKPLVKSSGK